MKSGTNGTIVAALGLLALGLLSGCQTKLEAPVAVEGAPKASSLPTDDRSIRPTLPNFSMKTLDGAKWELSSHRGKVVLVNFWATWCPPCREELPDLVRLDKEYRAKGLETVGISIDEDGVTKVKPFVASHGIPYPILMPKLGDPMLQSVPAVPVTLLIDRDGRIAHKLVGARSRAELEPMIQALLEEKGI